MVRPTKKRQVSYIPEVKLFNPARVPKCKLEEVVLTIEEIEAIRLKDKLGLTQQEASEQMEVSRPTFQRVLIEARAKIADALIEGKAIKFAGGDYEYKGQCNKCGKKTQHKNRVEKCRKKIICRECSEG